MVDFVDLSQLHFVSDQGDGDDRERLLDPGRVHGGRILQSARAESTGW